MRVLTTNRHEIYLSLLAQTGYQIDVLESLGEEKLPWNPQCGKPKENIQLIQWSKQVEQNIRSGETYDWIICHTIKDLIFFAPYRKARFIFVIHLALYSHSFFFKIKWLIKRLILELFYRSRTDCRIVAVSPYKKSTWCIDALSPKVILLATLPDVIKKPADHKHDYCSLVTVGNGFRYRKELHIKLLEKLQQHLSINAIGTNPGLKGEIRCKNRQEFLTLLSEHDLFIFTTPYPWNDSYNTSCLEAMASGLAIAALDHPYSLFKQGAAGICAKDEEHLLDEIKTLVKNPEKIAEMGRVNQRFIDEHFSLKNFVDEWKEITS